jgi:tRNA modification GTPase
MNSKAGYGDETPIAAFATTPGNSALTLIRCSGNGSIDLVSSVFAPARKNNAPTLIEVLGNTIVHGWIVKKEEVGSRKEEIESRKEEVGSRKELEKIDEVLVSVFRAPKSYTGEDSLDICCHGGNSAGKAVMNVLKNAGLRDALPGEFTFRAFMNGKLDLTRCESVMELVSAKTDTSRRHAVCRLSGSLYKEINDIKTLLVQVLAGAEIFLDYSEDEISADEDEIKGKLPNKEIVQEVQARLKKLSASWKVERIYQEGLTLVIAGCPNAGKSSLFNSLLKEDRSIVTEVPGTTRDWIEALVSIEGIPIRLIDTAGLRETADSVEKIGVERSIKILQEADIVLYLIDGENGFTKEDSKFITGNNSGSVPYLFVWNKCDIASLRESASPFPLEGILPICVSAKTGEGFTELFNAVASTVRMNVSCLDDLPSSATLGTVRQKNLVDSACTSLEEALELAESDEPLDLIAPLLREAVNSLGEITGEVSTAGILEEMFSRFCVGK